MGLITILTTDLVFGRMLELELLSAGHRVVFDRQSGNGTTAVRNEISGGLSSLSESVVVCDIDSASAMLSACDPNRTIAVASAADAVESCAAKRTLVRPFEISRLLKYADELCHSDTDESSAEIKPSDRIRIENDPPRAFFGGIRLDLTRREHELLACLYDKRGTPLSRSDLIRLVWHYDFEGQTNVVDVYIRYLREKIDLPFGVKLIETVRGKGYRMN